MKKFMIFTFSGLLLSGILYTGNVNSDTDAGESRTKKRSEHEGIE